MFRWGPIHQPTLVDSESLLVSRFAPPSNFNPETWFTPANYIAYGAPVYVVRAANTTSTNGKIGVLSALANSGAVANVLAQMVLNDTDYHNHDGLFDSNLQFVARYPGAIGNSLRVSVCYTGNAYTSTINLAAIGTGSTFAVNVNSNTATVVITAGSIGTANTAAENLVANLALTDVIDVGNSVIGVNRMKITAIQYDPAANAIGNTTTGTATITLSFEDPLSLHSNYSNTLVLTRHWEFFNFIGKPPGQSTWMGNNGNVAANDELHAVVVDDGGLFTGVPGTVLETYKFLSRATDAKGLDGGSIYFKTVINQQSQYVWYTNDNSLAVSNTGVNLTSSTEYAVVDLNFAGGADGADETAVSIAVLATGYDLFASTEDIDIALVMTGKARGDIFGGQLANYLIDNIAEIRKDCVIFCSPDVSDVVNNRGNEATALIGFRNDLRDSSYGFLDSGYKYQYDRYNDLYRWIPMNGDMAGLTARTDFTNDPWWSPAGFNRGNIKNVISLAYNPRQAERDEIYPHDINPVVSFPGYGIILFGDRTLQSIESAFSRINVRRLFIVLEKAISLMSRAFLFEFNDRFTQANFRNIVIPYLRDIQARRGITDFLVRCDDTNNTPTVIDANKFIGDIFIKPARSINWIVLNFVAVGTGLQFSEIENQIP